jgi:hypothetical protein
VEDETGRPNARQKFVHLHQRIEFSEHFAAPWFLGTNAVDRLLKKWLLQLDV